VNAALALAVELQHPFTSAYARFHAGLLHLWRRDADIALDRAVGLLEVADEHGFRIWTAAGSCLQGAARVGLGRFAEGLANIRDGMDLYQELRSPPVFWPFLLFVDARASHEAGLPAAGLAPLNGAIEILSADPGNTMLPEFYLLKGDLLAALATDTGSRRSDAEPWYRLALDRAAELKARMTQLRAATRLGRLLQAAGEPEAAAQILGPVYATFTEGFTTVDLIEARNLLDAVAG
jgi:adenylate cyclase